MQLLRVVLAILIPPLAVFLTLGWLPGSIHAVWAIVKHEEKEKLAAEEVARGNFS
jgi:uncharacterized membrane protein YqaE (UPF0057 family)